MAKRSILALIVAAALLAACSSAAATPFPAFDKGMSGNTAGVPAAPQEAAVGSTTSSSGNNSYARGGDANSSTAAVDRLVIRNASLTVVVEDPIKTMDVVTNLAGEMDGYVVSSNAYKVSLEGGGEAPEASITIRVAAEKLDEALQTIRSQVKDPQTDVLSENVTGQDVTKEYTDLQSRLRNLEDAETQLREIMASATKPEDVLNVFNQLTQVREEIEVLKGQIQYYQESAATSSISVQIKAEASVQPLTIGKWQPAGTARDAIQTLINALKFLANAAIWLVLFAVPVIAVIYIPLRLLWIGLRKLLNRRKPETSVPPAAPPAVPPAA